MIREHVVESLKDVLDEPMKEVGFRRARRSLVYRKKGAESEHRITFLLYCHPQYQPDAEAHLYPSFQLLMPKVREMAMLLVQENKLLLAGVPEIIIGQPADSAAPKEAHIRWFANGNEEITSACVSIKAFLFRWVLPFLDEVSTPLDLVKLYEKDDPRLLRLRHWYVFVAAAYKLLGAPDKAHGVVLERFGSIGLRKQYASLYATLGIN